MYTLNGISFYDYGIIPSQIGNGNIAVSGAWDMPARIGKIFHDWGDEDGIEPYLRSDEIFYGGRDIRFYGFMKTSSREEALSNLDAFFDALDSNDELLVLDGFELGSWEVYVKSAVNVKYHYEDNIAEIEFTFREPAATFEDVVIPESDSSHEGIDGLSWERLGVIFLTLTNDANRPAIKDQTVTAYGREVYQKTKRQFRELNFSGMIAQPDWISFKTVLNRLYKLFSMPNARTLYMPDGTVREVFVKDGFKVTNVAIETDRVIAELSITFAEIKQLQNWNKLTDSTGLILVDQYGQPLAEILKKF